MTKFNQFIDSLYSLQETFSPLIFTILGGCIIGFGSVHIINNLSETIELPPVPQIECNLR